MSYRLNTDEVFLLFAFSLVGLHLRLTEVFHQNSNPPMLINAFPLNYFLYIPRNHPLQKHPSCLFNNNRHFWELDAVLFVMTVLAIISIALSNSSIDTVKGGRSLSTFGPADKASSPCSRKIGSNGAISSVNSRPNINRLQRIATKSDTSFDSSSNLLYK